MIKLHTNSWETLDSGVSIKATDKTQLRKFHRDGLRAGRIQEGPYSPEALLKSLGLVANDNLNNAGNLLFGKNHPLRLKMAIFATNEKLTFLDMQVKEGNIFELLTAGEQYILGNIRWKVEINEMERKEIPEIPVAVIRELLANSFAHALYHANSVHEIDIHPGMIAIYNPGTFASPYSPKDYINNNRHFTLRNERIAKTLYTGKLIEGTGSGLKRVAALCKNSGIKYSFENSELGFKAIISRSSSDNATIQDVVLTETEKSVLALLKQNPKQTRDELAEKVCKTARTVQRAINSLRERGLLERAGAKKNGRWVVKD